MSSLCSLLTIALLVSGAAAQTQIPVFGQCGGLTYTGSTTCVAGYALNTATVPLSS